MIHEKATIIDETDEMIEEINQLHKETLVENLSSVPVPEGHSYRLSNRYKLFGTKAPPPFVPVAYEPV